MDSSIARFKDVSGLLYPHPPISRHRRWIISSRGQLCDHIRRAQILAAAVAAALEFELAFGEALGADQNLPGNADQVGGGEFGAGALVGVVVEHLDACRLKLAIELFAGRIGIVSTLLQVQDNGLE